MYFHVVGVSRMYVTIEKSRVLIKFKNMNNDLFVIQRLKIQKPIY